jgi:hypothetical protein
VASASSVDKDVIGGITRQLGRALLPIPLAKLGFLKLELHHFHFNGTPEGVALRRGKLRVLHRPLQLRLAQSSDPVQSARAGKVRYSRMN